MVGENCFISLSFKTSTLSSVKLYQLSAHLSKLQHRVMDWELIQGKYFQRNSTKIIKLSRLTFFFISAQSNFICPEKDGYFEDTKQCDKYYDCYDGIPEDRLCPDGLVFDPFSRKREPCDHYFNVDCGDRLDLRK